MRLRRILLTLSVMLLAAALISAESCNVDDHLDSPEPLPPEVLPQITGDIGSELSTYGRFEEKLEDVMEGKTIVIGPKGKTGFLVRPKSWCVCAVVSCPFWVFVKGRTGKYNVAARMNAYSLTANSRKTAHGL